MSALATQREHERGHEQPELVAETFEDGGGERGGHERRAAVRATAAPPPRARRRRTARGAPSCRTCPTLVFGHLVDERPPLRELPLRDVLGEELAAAPRRSSWRPRAATTHASGRSSHRGSGTAITAASSDRRVRHQVAFELHRRDPLPTRLDDVLRAVGDLDVAVGGDAGDVAGAQPAVVELLGRGVAVVRRGDPRPAHLDLADRLAVPRQHVAVVVDDAQLDAGQTRVR